MGRRPVGINLVVLSQGRYPGPDHGADLGDVRPGQPLGDSFVDDTATLAMRRSADSKRRRTDDLAQFIDQPTLVDVRLVGLKHGPDQRGVSQHVDWFGTHVQPRDFGRDAAPGQQEVKRVTPKCAKV